MIEEQRAWLINHLHEGHGLPGPDDAYESFADLKAAHDLLHESMRESEKSEVLPEVAGQNGQTPVG